MLKLEDVLQLKDAEDVKLISRRHAITLFPGLFGAFLLIVIPFFLLFPLFAWGIPGVIAFLASVIIGVVVAIRTFIIWDADVLIVTTTRIVDVDQKGVFSRIVSEAPVASIQDVSWRRHGIAETVFGMGTLRVAAERVTIEARRIPKPELVGEAINDLRHATTPKRTDLAPERQEALRRITKLLEGFSVEELGRIESILKARAKSDATESFLKTAEPPEGWTSHRNV